jgi:ElaB/YqjD/DUF883 family membrane-anchored ribosome-binding protein
MIARGVPFAVALALALGAAGCGDSDQPAYCDDRAALEQSLGQLGDVDLRVDGVDALTEQLRQVQRDANALVRSAQDEFGPEASALRSSIARLESSVRAAVDDPSPQRVSDVTVEASAAAAAFGELSDAVGSSCD